MSYALLKTIHMAAAALSYALFVLRGAWRFTGSPLAVQRWTRIVPHVNDTVLLLAAIAMVLQIAPRTGLHAFLAAKLAGLVCYILLGMTAFRWATELHTRVAAWIAAQAAFFYIVGVALTKSPSLGLLG